MNLGHIQKSVVDFLSRCEGNKGYIGSTCEAQEFRGLDLEQVERAINGLLRRKIIRKEGICYILNEKEMDLMI